LATATKNIALNTPAIFAKGLRASQGARLECHVAEQIYFDTDMASQKARKLSIYED
jgi:hypothetical protein